MSADAFIRCSIGGGCLVGKKKKEKIYGVKIALSYKNGRIWEGLWKKINLTFYTQISWPPYVPSHSKKVINSDSPSSLETSHILQRFG